MSRNPYVIVVELPEPGNLAPDTMNLARMAQGMIEDELRRRIPGVLVSIAGKQGEE